MNVLRGKYLKNGWTEFNVWAYLVFVPFLILVIFISFLATLFVRSLAQDLRYGISLKFCILWQKHGTLSEHFL